MKKVLLFFGKATLLIAVGILFLSCGQSENEKEAKRLQDSTESALIANKAALVEKGLEHEKFLNKLKSKPKFFLQYWYGMTHHEFLAVSDSLVRQGKLDYAANNQELWSWKGLFYNPDKWYSNFEAESLYSDDSYIYRAEKCCDLEPLFKNNGLVGIGLLNSERLYSDYQKKYKIPSLQKKNIMSSYWLEELAGRNGSGEKVYRTIGKISFEDAKQLYDIEANGSFRNSLPQDEIVIIKNENTAIVFRNEISAHTEHFKTTPHMASVYSYKDQIYTQGVLDVEKTKEEAKVRLSYTYTYGDYISITYLPQEFYEEYIYLKEGRESKKEKPIQRTGSFEDEI
jgi:hypothetical protein